MCEYRKLDCGIVIRLNPDGTSDWPYGPRKGTARVEGVPASETEFKRQQAFVWQMFTQLLDDFAGFVVQLSDEEYDVAFAAFGYALLTYDNKRGTSIHGYAWRMAKYAIAALRKQSAQAAASYLEEHQGAENFIGQIEANVDILRYKAELSREQWQLLLARFDSYLSYDEIAREFGYASRTTAMNKVAQALAVCRQRAFP